MAVVRITAENGARFALATRLSQGLPQASAGPAAPVDVAIACQAAGNPDLAPNLIGDGAMLEAVHATIAAAAEQRACYADPPPPAVVPPTLSGAELAGVYTRFNRTPAAVSPIPVGLRPSLDGGEIRNSTPV